MRAAFGLATDYVQAAYLTPIRDRALPDMALPSQFGEVRLTGVRLSIDEFAELALRPSPGALTGSLAVKRISVYIARLRIPFGQGVDCTGMTLRVAYGSPLVPALTLSPRANGGGLHFDLGALRLDVPATNYDAIGPANCIGLPVGNDLVRRVVADTMAHANSDLAQAIRAQATAFLGGLDGAVNDRLRAGLNLDVPAGAPFIAAGRINLRPIVRDIRVGDQGVRLSAQPIVARVPPGDEPRAAIASTPSFKPRQELARLELSAAQVNAMLAAVFSAHAAPVRFSPDDAELIGAVFFRDNFAPALPELQHLRLDRDEFAIAPEFPPGVVPQVALTEAGELRLILPRLIVHLSYYQGGKAVPFFALELAGALDLTTIPGKISLLLDPKSPLHGGGTWEPGYTPRDSTIHQDKLEAFAHDFVAGLEGMDFLEKAKIPGVRLGSRRLGLMGFGFDPERVTIRVGE